MPFIRKVLDKINNIIPEWEADLVRNLSQRNLSNRGTTSQTHTTSSRPHTSSQPRATQEHSSRRQGTSNGMNRHGNSAGSNALENEIRDALRAHNSARASAAGSLRPLQWDSRLAAEAQSWAEQLARRNHMEHDPNCRQSVGENLAKVLSWGPGGHREVYYLKAVQLWNAEKPEYRGQRIGEGDMAKYAHYTQVIWPTTTHVGMGKAESSTGHWFHVARYWPAGNLLGTRLRI